MPNGSLDLTASVTTSFKLSVGTSASLLGTLILNLKNITINGSMNFGGVRNAQIDIENVIVTTGTATSYIIQSWSYLEGITNINIGNWKSSATQSSGVIASCVASVVGGKPVINLNVNNVETPTSALLLHGYVNTPITLNASVNKAVVSQSALSNWGSNNGTGKVNYIFPDTLLDGDIRLYGSLYVSLTGKVKLINNTEQYLFYNSIGYKTIDLFDLHLNIDSTLSQGVIYDDDDTIINLRDVYIKFNSDKPFLSSTAVNTHTGAVNIDGMVVIESLTDGKYFWGQNVATTGSTINIRGILKTNMLLDTQNGGGQVLVNNLLPEKGTSTRITDAGVTTTYNFNHLTATDWKLTMIANTTFTESNLPIGNETLEYTFKLTGAFTPTFPTYWDVLGDAYDGAVWNFIAVQIHNGNSGSEEVTVFISNIV